MIMQLNLLKKKIFYKLIQKYFQLILMKFFDIFIILEFG
jgi:hypothetical protein